MKRRQLWKGISAAALVRSAAAVLGFQWNQRNTVVLPPTTAAPVETVSGNTFAQAEEASRYRVAVIAGSAKAIQALERAHAAAVGQPEPDLDAVARLEQQLTEKRRQLSLAQR